MQMQSVFLRLRNKKFNDAFNNAQWNNAHFVWIVQMYVILEQWNLSYLNIEISYFIISNFIDF